ncbi:MAG: molybdate transport system permease protein [Clostridiales bacterium]|jgi:molybdate transport system permease protein|nr:molybdate transport system permease protein [Clostridiales bacterium]
MENSVSQVLSKTKRSRQKPKSMLNGAITILIAVNVMAIILVILSLFIKTSPAAIQSMITSFKVKSAISISVCSIILSLGIVMLLGTPIAYGLSQKKGGFYALIEGVFSIPIVLPPSVTGLALLMTYGRRGLIGTWLNELGVTLPFSFIAIVIVQVFVTMPYYIQIVKNGFANVDKSIAEAARTFGASELEVLLLIYMPMTFKAMLSALILCAFRAAGEFGATIMFAGNLEGKTQTITTRIYTLYQMDLTQSVSLAVVQIVVFILPLLFLKIKLD